MVYVNPPLFIIKSLIHVMGVEKLRQPWEIPTAVLVLNSSPPPDGEGDILLKIT